jgi:Pyruvate/2-oxoacid:ferredoxin oxidoreductase delta subunit
MSILDQAVLRVLLYEGKGSKPIENRGTILSTLLSNGFPVTCVREQGSVTPQDGSHLLVMGLFEGEEPPLSFDSSGNVAIYFQDLTGLADDALLEKVQSFREQAAARVPGEWTPWFPVIDYDRCTNCMQCLSFCLFGVYGVSEKAEIQVQNNDKCKTNCPACSRVCPEAAIMFPKYRNGPVNGDLVTDADVQRESMKIDISSLLGGDIYATLRKRDEIAKERFAKERDDDRALAERQRCLAKMQKEMDIPADVLMSLPSQDEIKQRAEDAKKAADEAIGLRDGIKADDRKEL